MERRRPPPPEDLAFPRPWEPRPISKARWEHHRDRLMSRVCGHRPPEWWLYERDMQPPTRYRQDRVLFAMGELKGGELQQCLQWWRYHYDDANAMDDRTKYWRWKDLPPKLVQQWDRERRRALQKTGLLVPIA